MRKKLNSDDPRSWIIFLPSGRRGGTADGLNCAKGPDACTTFCCVSVTMVFRGRPGFRRIGGSLMVHGWLVEAGASWDAGSDGREGPADESSTKMVKIIIFKFTTQHFRLTLLFSLRRCRLSSVRTGSGWRTWLHRCRNLFWFGPNC